MNIKNVHRWKRLKMVKREDRPQISPKRIPGTVVDDSSFPSFATKYSIRRKLTKYIVLLLICSSLKENIFRMLTVGTLHFHEVKIMCLGSSNSVGIKL